MVPFYLLAGTRRYSEITLADPRLLLGLIALTVWAVRWLRTERPPSAERYARGAPWPVVAFVIVSYAAWLRLYGIYRYLYPLELILVATTFGLLSTMVRARSHKTALIVGMMLVLATTSRPDWGRQPFSSPMVSIRFPRIPSDSLVVLAGGNPLGHAVAFLPGRIRAVSVHNDFMDPDRCTRLQARAEDRIRRHAGPLHLLREVSEPPKTGGRFEAYGLSLQGACVPVFASLAALELCPLSRALVRPPRCSLSVIDG